MAASRSLSFTRSSSAPRTRVSPSAQAAAMKNTGNSSIASGTSASGTLMPCRRLLRTSMSATGSPLGGVARPRDGVVHPDVGAHLQQQLEQPGARRIDADVAQQQPVLGGQAAGHHEERRRGEVAGHADVRRRAASGHPRWRPSRPLAATSTPNAREHPLGVVARGRRLGHARAAVGLQSREQHRRLHLRARHRQRVVDGAQRARRPRSPPAAAVVCLDVGAHRAAAARPRAPSAGASATHRRSASSRSAAGASRPMNRRIAVPALPMSSGAAAAAQAVEPDAVHDDVLVPPGARCARPCACSARSVARQSSPARKPVMSVTPSAMPPSISARCEIDLSPGTVISPATVPPGPTTIARHRPLQFTAPRADRSRARGTARRASSAPRAPCATCGSSQCPSMSMKNT